MFMYDHDPFGFGPQTSLAAARDWLAGRIVGEGEGVSASCPFNGSTRVDRSILSPDGRKSLDAILFVWHNSIVPKLRPRMLRAGWGCDHRFAPFPGHGTVSMITMTGPTLDMIARTIGRVLDSPPQYQNDEPVLARWCALLRHSGTAPESAEAEATDDDLIPKSIVDAVFGGKVPAFEED